MKDLEDLAMEAKFVGVYDRNRENIILRNTAYRDGKEEGCEEGSLNKSIEIAKEMLVNNENIEKISKYTGLSTTELKKIH